MAVVARVRSAALVNVREQIPLVGTKDGVNRVFILPSGEKAVHTPGSGPVLKVYFDTRRLQDTEMSISESGGVGTGFDTVTVTAFAPKAISSIFADYLVA